jgi:KaiC/GvpD/RAD55 family RecA-like ATPase
MNRRTLVISLLLVAICFSFFSISDVSSKGKGGGGGKGGSHGSHGGGNNDRPTQILLTDSTPVATTTTMTISQPTSGQCAVRSLPFSALKGDEIAGTYGSDSQVNFYILTLDELNSIQNCRLPSTARPAFIEENSVGHSNNYRSLPFPANGTYYFVFMYLRGPTNSASGYVTVELSFPTSASTSINDTSSSSTAQMSLILLQSSLSPTSTSVIATTVTSQAESSVASYFGAGGVVALVVSIGVVGSVMVVRRRKEVSIKNGVTAAVEVLPQDAKLMELSIQSDVVGRLSTGYGDLDNLLVGGLPKGYAILLLSPSCDERDLLLRKIIGSAARAAMPTFYLSNDIGKTQDLARTYSKKFFALCPQADKVLSRSANLYKIPSIDSLSDINIAFMEIVGERANDRSDNKLVIFDLLTDMLLLHKGVTARKWFSDFVARRKAEGFTVLAFLNPLVASTEETQTLIDLFDGVIEIYEKELRERSRRFLVIKRMYGQKYSESELMLDKDRLFQLA